MTLTLTETEAKLLQSAMALVGTIIKDREDQDWLNLNRKINEPKPRRTSGLVRKTKRKKRAGQWFYDGKQHSLHSRKRSSDDCAAGTVAVLLRLSEHQHPRTNTLLSRRIKQVHQPVRQPSRSRSVGQPHHPRFSRSGSLPTKWYTRTQVLAR